MSKILGRPLYAPAPAGGGKPSAPKFTYDGDYVIRDDGVVELLTSGTITFLSPAVIDIFCVGGGGGGGDALYGSGSSGQTGGGGGGYTKTVKSLQVLSQQAIPITIGAGGNSQRDGGASSWGDYSANGGLRGGNYGAGGNGGSGGGAGNNGKGGSDGSNGGGGISNIPAGIGQGSTTREFGELTGKLYAGGGSGAGGGTGGEGGGGNAGYNAAGGNGVANSGGGGGGTKSDNASTTYLGGKGGSGIVCFRAAQ